MALENSPVLNTLLGCPKDPRIFEWDSIYAMHIAKGSRFYIYYTNIITANR